MTNNRHDPDMRDRWTCPSCRTDLVGDPEDLGHRETSFETELERSVYEFIRVGVAVRGRRSARQLREEYLRWRQEARPWEMDKVAGQDFADALLNAGVRPMAVWGGSAWLVPLEPGQKSNSGMLQGRIQIDLVDIREGTLFCPVCRACIGSLTKDPSAARPSDWPEEGTQLRRAYDVLVEWLRTVVSPGEHITSDLWDRFQSYSPGASAALGSLNAFSRALLASGLGTRARTAKHRLFVVHAREGDSIPAADGQAPSQAQEA